MPDLPELTDYAIQMPGGHFAPWIMVRDGKKVSGEFPDANAAEKAALAESEAA
jgi:hypothetical protein